jgi:hypothetical protein
MDRKPLRTLLFGMVAFVLVLALTAMIFRYQTRVIDRSVLVVDRWTDRVSLVHPDGAVSNIPGNMPVQKRFLLESHTLPEYDEARIRVSAHWRSGKSRVHVRIKPVSGNLNEAREDAGNAFHLALTDRGGFTVYQFDVPLSKMHAEQDQAGNVLYLEYRHTASLSREAFRAIKGWDIR